MKRFQLFFLIFSIFCFVNAAYSQGAGQEKITADEVLQRVQLKPQVEISIDQKSRSIASSLNIDVKITNLTVYDITLNKVTIDMPGAFVNSRVETCTLEYPETPTDIRLNAGNTFFHRFSFKTADINWYSILINWELLLFSPGEYNINIIVDYKIPPVSTTMTQENKKIFFEPPLSSMVWGGILGSFLLALFLKLYGLIRGIKKSESLSVKIFWQMLKEIFLIVIAGSVCAFIAIILIYRFKDLQLPINITVNDFYGGVVIGLFTYKIGDWLYKQIAMNKEQKKAEN